MSQALLCLERCGARPENPTSLAKVAFWMSQGPESTRGFPLFWNIPRIDHQSHPVSRPLLPVPFSQDPLVLLVSFSSPPLDVFPSTVDADRDPAPGGGEENKVVAKTSSYLGKPLLDTAP